MTNHFLYALDFDGVICDSAIETAMTGFKSAQYFWPEMAGVSIDQPSIDAFRQVRPYLETGYEATLIMRALFQGTSANDLCRHYETHLGDLLIESNLDIATLKQQFARVRDQWIQKDEQDWLDHNPLFPGIESPLRSLSKDAFYILTTKQERFVSRILRGNNISIPMPQIFGMDRQHSKQDVLQQLLRQHPEKSIIFIEDRLPTLLKVQHNPALKNIRLRLADWGYNTAQDKQQAQEKAIEVITVRSLSDLTV